MKEFMKWLFLFPDNNLNKTVYTKNWFSSIKKLLNRVFNTNIILFYTNDETFYNMVTYI